METKKALRFSFSIFAIIIGGAVFEQFDFDNLKFENPALAIVYIIVLAFSIYIVFGNNKNQPGE